MEDSTITFGGSCRMEKEENMAKKTIWLRRCGIELSHENPPRPVRMYEVVKTQNTFSPTVGDQLKESEARKLCNDETTVNIS